MDKVEKETKTLLRGNKKTKEGMTEEEQEIRADLKTCIELGDEKVALAVQTYELVNLAMSFSIGLIFDQRSISIYEGWTWT